MTITRGRRTEDSGNVLLRFNLHMEKRGFKFNVLTGHENEASIDSIQLVLDGSAQWLIFSKRHWDCIGNWKSVRISVLKLWKMQIYVEISTNNDISKLLSATMGINSGFTPKQATIVPEITGLAESSELQNPFFPQEKCVSAEAKKNQEKLSTDTKQRIEERNKKKKNSGLIPDLQNWKIFCNLLIAMNKGNLQNRLQ
ncbi:unnamed protein product [Sphenostylis stenocarpa]|uniref:Uncharacterized protein n=1 Tax=Sphenostylis stenocarpa TaxID=92480 RepID=A0AA86T3U3_9FABA|nr:unnamed protein product [Sphenostylis stenocarpa]